MLERRALSHSSTLVCTESKCQYLGFRCSQAALCNVCLPIQVGVLPGLAPHVTPHLAAPQASGWAACGIDGEAASSGYRLQCQRFHFWHCRIAWLLLSLLPSFPTTTKVCVSFLLIFKLTPCLCQKSFLWFLGCCLIQLVVIFLISIITMGPLNT